MNILADALSNTISISEFNKGKAGQIFNEVNSAGSKIVIKNNKPISVIISPKDYLELMEDLENRTLLEMVYDRLANFDVSKLKAASDVYAELGITEEDLGDLSDVEFE